MDQIVDWAIVLLVFFFITRYIMKSTHIAGENERFATFKLGKFSGFTGPGLVISGPYWQMFRLSVGEVGKVTSSEFVQFRGQEVPAKRASQFRVGQVVRIDGFEDDGLVLVATGSAKYRCPNCNHEF